MKIAFYQMRPFDEQAYIEQFSREFGIDYVTIPGAPCPENLDKAAGCDAVSQNPCEILPEYVEAWARMGVKYLLCRSIGYDHIPLETAKKLGMRVAHSHYPPEGVANYAIMLMLMCTRKMNQTMLRAAAQDYTLPGKMGKDIVQLHGRRHRHRQNRPHCHCPFAGLWLQNFGLRPVPERRGGPNAPSMSRWTSCTPAATSSPCTPMPPPRTTTSSMPTSLAKMKDGVLIVNTARGALIDEEALIAALESGKVGGAGLDVVEEENDLVYFNRAGAALPHRTMNILRSMPNVIVSPHNAFYTDVNVASMVRSAL